MSSRGWRAAWSLLRRAFDPIPVAPHDAHVETRSFNVCGRRSVRWAHALANGRTSSNALHHRRPRSVVWRNTERAVHGSTYGTRGYAIDNNMTHENTENVWETVVGLELHVQLSTATKLFSSASAGPSSKVSSSQSPNTRVAPFDAAWPGALPSLNKKAVELAARIGIALNGTVQKSSHFDRKHYFYQDQPHGYQITQHKNPIVKGGVLEFFANKTVKKGGSYGNDSGSKPTTPTRLRIEQIQLEADTGKSSVVSAVMRSERERDGKNYKDWLVDYNRAGSALVEIVTRPDLRSANEAASAIEHVQKMVRFLGVSSANMEDGSLRADVNVSVRRRDDKNIFGERCEIKNLNSFKSVRLAVEVEVKRQVSILENGGLVTRETRGYDVQNNKTYTLRTKEQIAEYRFAPEPDVPAVIFSEAEIDDIKRTVPELPNAALIRLTDLKGKFNLAPDLAKKVTGHPSTLQFYELALRSAEETVEEKTKSDSDTKNINKVFPSDVAHFVVGELVGAAKRAQVVRSANAPLAHLPASASPTLVGELCGLVSLSEITARMAKKTIAAMLVAEEEDGKYPSARQTVFSLFGETEPSVSQCGSTGGDANGSIPGGQEDRTLVELCREIIAEKPTEAKLFQSGKRRLMGLFVGQVLKRTGGTADPKKVSEVLKRLLEE